MEIIEAVENRPEYDELCESVRILFISIKGTLDSAVEG